MTLIDCYASALLCRIGARSTQSGEPEPVLLKPKTLSRTKIRDKLTKYGVTSDWLKSDTEQLNFVAIIVFIHVCIRCIHEGTVAQNAEDTFELAADLFTFKVTHVPVTSADFMDTLVHVLYYLACGLAQKSALFDDYKRVCNLPIAYQAYTADNTELAKDLGVELSKLFKK
jgi:hypothetical protein